MLRQLVELLLMRGMMRLLQQHRPAASRCVSSAVITAARPTAWVSVFADYILLLKFIDHGRPLLVLFLLLPHQWYLRQYLPNPQKQIVLLLW